ncbi:MAG: AgmX/PglI C-terminal domain-containing protein [Gammaproteobacteria bacterium]|nr:AgmX/PglI C-terminal domain-containing protein [Gammaproteobacteria bacterium]
MDDGVPENSENAADEKSIRDQVERSEREMHGYEQQLRAVEGELEELARRAHQYELLSQACQTLEELDSAGGANLFWGNETQPGTSAEKLLFARGKLNDYTNEIQAVERRRDAVLAKIDDQHEVLDCLHYDLRDLVESEESRRAEWIVERDADEQPYRAQVMPWARGCDEDRRLRHNVLASIAVSVLVAVLVGVVDIPIPEREKLIELPERVAKLVRQEQAKPPEPEPQPQPVVPEDELPEEPELAEEIPPEVTPEAVEKPQVAQEVKPDTREQVKTKGILAFRDSFASRAQLKTSARLGSQARIRNSGEDAVGRPQRMMVSTSAPGSSGGINLAEISRDVGGGGGSLEGVEVGRVASAIGDAEGSDRPLSGGMSSGRTDEEIQIVFDRYKAALYRLYNRELRRDPTLRGQLVLRLTIEPDGSVSLCQLQSSDMNAPTLAEQVVNRVLTFDFGAKEDIVAMTIIYPIDFLPAA